MTTSLIVPRKESLNYKEQEVNSRLINMFGEHDITFIDHSDSIDIERYLNKSKVHLNKSGQQNLLKKFSNFYCSRIDIVLITVVTLP